MRRLALTCLAAAAILSPLACRRGGAPAASPGAPVFLVSVDTLRADRLPAYGFAGVSTPAIDALRKDAILVDRAFAHVPLTVPSHGTVMTGLLPADSGLRDNLGYKLSPSVKPLAEILKGAGYETGAAVSSVVLTGSATGLSRGFDLYDDAVDPPGDATPISRVQRSGGATLEALLPWLTSRTTKRIFGFLHVYEPHSPYDPPEPFRTTYASDPYLGEIAAADAVVGRFVDELKKKGLYDDALVVLLSDHGEGLGDHGESEHGVFLYREVLHVPLLVKLPKGALAGTRVAAPVALRDVFPTILGVVAPGAAPTPAGALDLVPLAAGEAAPERTILAESLFPRIHFGWSELFALWDGRWQYVKAPKPEVYDLETDPAQKKNLFAEKPPALRRLVAEMERLRPAFAAPSGSDPEQARKLASLGYLSGGGSNDSEGGPDPKDELATFERIKGGLKLVVRGKPDEALPYFDEALARNPRMMDVWEVRAQALEKLGRMDDALASMKKAVALAPAGSTTYLVAVANLAMRMGRLDEAISHAKLAGELGDPAMDELLGRAYLAKGDVAAAERHARASLASERSRGRGFLVLARIEQQRGRPAAALARLDELVARRGLESAGTEVGFHWIRGDLLARMARIGEAEKEFLEEIRRHPANTNGYTALVALLAAQGRRDDARRVAEALAAAVPTESGRATASGVLRMVGDAEGAARLAGRRG